jgi:hypothetical protein
MNLLEGALFVWKSALKACAPPTLTCFLRPCVLNKLSCLQDVVYGNSIDVIALTETWLSNRVQNDEILPIGYKLFRRDRQTGKRGGGVLLVYS